jgi:hypothetical protein
MPALLDGVANISPLLKILTPGLFLLVRAKFETGLPPSFLTLITRSNNELSSHDLVNSTQSDISLPAILPTSNARLL